MNLRNKDTSIIRKVLLGPKVSGIDRLECCLNRDGGSRGFNRQYGVSGSDHQTGFTVLYPS